LDIRDLKVKSPLGRGAKGVVFLVENGDGELLALKAVLQSSVEKKARKMMMMMKKDSRFSHDGEHRRIFIEREVLASLDHPLLPKLRGIVVTDTVVGYAMDYCSGGDLNSLRKRQTEQMFSEDSIRFYAAELVLALEYLHDLGIVYRDLKPENVMVQENGHLMLVDFDLSIKLSAKSPDDDCRSPPSSDSDLSLLSDVEWTTGSETDSVEKSKSKSKSKSNSFVGTEEYISPEVILGEGHDFAVDMWCLGVVLYEMLYGTTPFRGANRKETFHRILKSPPNLTGGATALRDLIGKLLNKDQEKRIGIREAKSHKFFAAVDWDWITELSRPPFIPALPPPTSATEKEIDVDSFVQRVFNCKAEGER
ncbi:oxidative signal-inducible1, partial [Genlisea aurea]